MTDKPMKNGRKYIDSGFVHDVEILLLSKRYNIKVKELPVRWIHRKNSKLNLIYDSVIMLIGLMRIKINYLFS